MVLSISSQLSHTFCTYLSILLKLYDTSFKLSLDFSSVLQVCIYLVKLKLQLNFNLVQVTELHVCVYAQLLHRWIYFCAAPCIAYLNRDHLLRTYYIPLLCKNSQERPTYICTLYMCVIEHDYYMMQGMCIVGNRDGNTSFYEVVTIMINMQQYPVSSISRCKVLMTKLYSLEAHIIPYMYVYCNLENFCVRKLL